MEAMSLSLGYGINFSSQGLCGTFAFGKWIFSAVLFFCHRTLTSFTGGAIPSRFWVYHCEGYSGMIGDELAGCAGSFFHHCVSR
jgi:hypothetical protein